MTKAEAIALLEEWTTALEYAQRVFQEQKAKPRDIYDGYRAEAMTWAALSGWLNLEDKTGGLLEREPGLLTRTKAALGQKRRRPPSHARCRCGHANGAHCGRDGLGACDVSVRPGELCECDHFEAASEPAT